MTQHETETKTTRPLDEAKAQAFLGKVITDCGAALSAPLVLIGDALGLYKAMAFAGPQTSAELAARTGTNERYIREWLLNQAAGGYIEHDPATDRYSLPDEHAVALTDDTSPLYVGGMFHIVAAVSRAQSRIQAAFRTGEGMLWGEHDAALFPATERLFRPGYVANLIASWIPALDGVQAKLEKGAKVADIGCGHGASTLVLAEAYPNSRFHGFDNHGPSIEAARQAAQEAGVGERVTFEVAGAQNYSGADYDLVAFFDCLHDMGDPIGAMRHTAETLASDGTVLIVEPMAGNSVEEDINPVSRFYSAASVLLCMPNAIASGPLALGNQVSEQKLREVVNAGGLTRFRRATQTPINRIFEARR
ncbi:MAG: methyltransferase domain-containing protein [Ktedonobacterales bacterium]|nr:methyltransferase domain-containing protein [Ktedonobacterales bacterium]